jgi:YidC/Oxa1 family membrane protein insertase
MRLGEKPSSEVENIKLEVKETSEEKNWATLQNIPTELVKQYLAEECCFHIYDKPPTTLEEMERLKELYADDKARLNQEVMSLYKREKVNPVSGCLPLLVQIPVFFSIYKVLYVTIEMRHAPFFGWIKDLSAPDPTTIFNLFGLLPFTPPSFLMLGVWPLFMAMTMFLQQKMSPQPTDPVQAQVMKFMPLMFLFMFSGFPAGLLIYWSWNNILSIVQQFYINKLDTNGS